MMGVMKLAMKDVEEMKNKEKEIIKKAKKDKKKQEAKKQW